MKKILLILGILAVVAPVVADDSVPAQSAEPATGLNVSELIKAKSDIEEGCSGDAFQVDTSETPLQMAAVYVDGCASGTYLNVANDASIGNDGTLLGVSCKQCEIGHECTGVAANEISIESGFLTDDQGIKPCDAGTYADVEGKDKCDYCVAGTYQPEEGQDHCESADPKYYAYGPSGSGEGATEQKLCPTGYQDGDGAASIYECKKQISCSTYAANFLGTMTPKTLASGEDMVNYRDISNHCFNTESSTSPLVCNVDGHNTKQNLYQWVVENPEKITSVAGCSISGVIEIEEWNIDTQKWDKITEPCDNNQEPGTVKMVFTGDNTPMQSASFAAVCSNKTAMIIPAKIKVDDTFETNPEYADLTAQSTGSYCFMRNVDLPDQPWLMFGGYGTIAECEAECGDFNDDAYPLVQTKYKNGTSYLIVKDSNSNYYAKDGNNFIPLIAIPANTCYDAATGEIYSDLTNSESCWNNGHSWTKQDSFVDTNATAVTDVSNYTYVAYDDAIQLISGAAAMTADDENTEVCVANKVHINWGDVTLDANDPANTCTYGGALITPTSEPASDGSRLFLGWKPVASTPAP